MKTSKSRLSKFLAFIHVSGKFTAVHTMLAGKDVIPIAPTGSMKSLTYWMPLLFIKYGITMVVTPLKLLGGQFSKMLQHNGVSAVLSLWLMQQMNFLRQVFLYYLLILLTPFTNRCLVYCLGTIPRGDRKST